MRSIWKFPLCITPEQVIRIPKGAKVLSVGVVDNEPRIWADVDTEAPEVFRTVFMFGTGHEIDQAFNEQFVGTYVLNDGFVGHVFVGHWENKASLSRE